MKAPLISRRTVLRGFGTAVALPLLDAMLPMGLGAEARVRLTLLEQELAPDDALPAHRVEHVDEVGHRVVLVEHVAHDDLHRLDGLAFGRAGAYRREPELRGRFLDRLRLVGRERHLLGAGRARERAGGREEAEKQRPACGA